MIGPPDDHPRQSYQSVTFRRLADRDSALVIRNLDLHRCSFDNCRLSTGNDPQTRTAIRSITVSDCRIVGRFGMIGAPILDQITIHNFHSGQVLIFRGAAFRHVTLKGHIPAINFNEKVAFGAVSPACAEAFARANQEFYRSVDWALDISQAEFPSLRLSSIPGELIRRDPDTQVLVSKSRLQNSDWQSLPLPAITRIGIESCLAGRHENSVICAGKRSTHFAEARTGIEVLRRAGFAQS